MAEPALKLEFNSKEASDNDAVKEQKEIKNIISETYTSEFIIGLCGPIGSDIHSVGECFKRVLSDHYNYECIVIKLSDYIRRYKKAEIDESKNKGDVYHQLISAGNTMREEYGPSILSELAINDIYYCLQV